MSKFALEKKEEIKGKLEFYVLVKDGKNQYEETIEALKAQGNYDSELITLQTRLQQMAELMLMPKTKCRDITPENEDNKEYELKTKHLRLYVFHLDKKGRVIVFLGKKTSQKKDIKKFRSIKNQYLESL